MKRRLPLTFKLAVAISLTLCTVLISVAHVLYFHDPDTFLFYMVLDLAFVPIQVLFVSVFLDHLLKQRERKEKFSKLNMVIGSFFSEAGRELLGMLAHLAREAPRLGEVMAVTPKWGRADYLAAINALAGLKYKLVFSVADMEEMKRFLGEKRPFIMGLLQNPNLLEHERFTDLLWAVCHLGEELHFRESLEGLPAPDIEHLLLDARRAFTAVMREWLHYLMHLKDSYPYIHSLAVRLNPFDPRATPVIGQAPKAG